MNDRSNTRIYLVLPPNILRRAREVIAARFPEADLDAPGIHSEMFVFANTFGQGPIPALTVSAYPQITLRATTLAAEGRFAQPEVSLPPLRDEFVKLGMTPPTGMQHIVAVVPGILAVSASLAHKLEDWGYLCKPDFPGPIGCPPKDTPLPYLAEVVFRLLAGDAAQNLLNALDTRSNPIDINKRIASGEIPAALTIPAFARTFRAGSGHMVWPKSGALTIPLMACLAADAAPVAHAILAYLLSDEFQCVVVSDGVIAPAIPDVPRFEELEENA
jgi:ABC-type Fe3+ transport system substrate-binding protein